MEEFDENHKFNNQLEYINLIHIDADIIYIDENKDTPTLPIVKFFKRVIKLNVGYRQVLTLTISLAFKRLNFHVSKYVL